MKFSKVPKPVIYDTKIGDIPKEVLRELYRTMLKIQKVELKIDELYLEDEMKTPVHLCLGQEAVAAVIQKKTLGQWLEEAIIEKVDREQKQGKEIQK